MPLISFKKMLNTALENSFAVCYLEAWDHLSLEVITETAEEMSAPIILGFGVSKADPEWVEKWGLDYYSSMVQLAVSKTSSPVCLILNEAQSFDQCRRAIENGFNVVAKDSSHLSFKENINITRELVKVAHTHDVGVEAQLGRLPEDQFNEHDSRESYSLTKLDEARKFVEETGIDALSVCIGNIHCSVNTEAKVDLQLLKRLHGATEVPFVVHGGTSFPLDLMKQAIKQGVAKFNVGTIFKQVFYEGLKDSLNTGNDNLDFQTLISSHKKGDITREGIRRVKEQVKRFISCTNSSDKSYLFK